MYHILTNDNEVCIPSLSSILLAVFPCQNTDPVTFQQKLNDITYDVIA